jgi:hypothetical protein
MHVNEFSSNTNEWQLLISATSLHALSTNLKQKCWVHNSSYMFRSIEYTCTSKTDESTMPWYPSNGGDKQLWVLILKQQKGRKFCKTSVFEILLFLYH